VGPIKKNFPLFLTSTARSIHGSLDGAAPIGEHYLVQRNLLSLLTNCCRKGEFVKIEICIGSFSFNLSVPIFQYCCLKIVHFLWIVT